MSWMKKIIRQLAFGKKKMAVPDFNNLMSVFREASSKR